MINRATLGLGVLTGLVALVFFVSLLAAPFVSQPVMDAAPARLRQGRPGSLIAPRRARVSRYLVERERAALAREIAADRPVASGGAVDTIVAAFYVTWQPGGLLQLRANKDRLTHLMPEWMHVARDGASLDLRDWDPAVVTGNTEVVQIAQSSGIDILPILNNAEARQFDPVRAALMLRSPERRRALAGHVRDFVVANGFDGINIDFESLEPQDYERLPAFIAELKSTLPDSMLVTADIEARLDPALVARIAHAADFVILMAYAQTGTNDEPGPLASTSWYDSVVTRLSAAVPQGKLVIGIGSYGIDWTRGAGGVPITVEGAWAAAKEHRTEAPKDVIDFDNQALNPTFVYAGDSSEAHEVWFLDAACVYNQLTLVQRHGAVGTALWVLGAEDPSLWELYDRRRHATLPPPSVLDTVRAPGGLEYTNPDGEILSIASLPHAGLRRLDRDSVTGLVTDETYLDYPQPFIVRRQGYRAGLLALTFDDGPDDIYTDEILDTLDALGVKATFFLVGRNVGLYPDVVRRIVRDGHEIGNHTFTHPNMATIGRRRATLELNATQRAIQSITGRSTTLFRIPYNTDAEPQNGTEAGPLVLANSLGYVTVGEQIDPQDWKTVEYDSTNHRVPWSIKGIVDTTLWQVQHIRGNMILLHSAGGDRSRTVKAVPAIVRRLEEEGYRFVPVSVLLNSTRDRIMPPVTARDLVLVGVDRVTFETLDAAELVLTTGFLAALVLALLRAGIVVPLAFAGRRAARRMRFDPAYQPPVTIMIAAYNEATVIARTVRAALDSAWPELEVIVVDDGSTDDTPQALAAFAGDPRVRVVRQANAGKAAALNAAIAMAKHEILVGFDADTIVEPDAIAMLARHFANPAVAAVAGNVKVGNRINTLTIWQSIEYITSQNLDRRAFSHLNGVLVVPGAIGAWRRSAVAAVGGYIPDTLAEDMDLTFRLRRHGGTIENEPDAYGWTEAPETFRGFLRQRFRWAFGSLQVLWKHRGALAHHGWFGWLVLPSQWLFGVVFQILGPIVDLRLLWSLVAVGISAIETTQQDFSPQAQLLRILAQTGFFYAVFFAVELAAAVVALRMDDEDPKQLLWLFWQRFVYRQTMYYVLWKALVGAVKGKAFGWGKLQRTGSVDVEKWGGGEVGKPA